MDELIGELFPAPGKEIILLLIGLGKLETEHPGDIHSKMVGIHHDIIPGIGLHIRCDLPVAGILHVRIVAPYPHLE